MDVFNCTNKETDNASLIIAPWLHKVIKGHSGVQFGKNGERNNGVCYFDLFEAIQEIFMHLSTSGEIPITSSANFRRKLERYASCLVKNADSENVLRICNAFREVVEKSIPRPGAITESEIKFSSTSIMIIEICASSEIYLQEVPEILNGCVENTGIELIDSTEPIKVDSNIERHAKLQKEIDSSYGLYECLIDCDPTNEFIVSHFNDVMVGISKLAYCISLNGYCKNIIEQIETITEYWELSLDSLKKEKEDSISKYNTKVNGKANEVIRKISISKEAIKTINKTINDFKTNFQAFNSEKEPTGP